MLSVLKKCYCAGAIVLLLATLAKFYTWQVHFDAGVREFSQMFWKVKETHNELKTETSARNVGDSSMIISDERPERDFRTYVNNSHFVLGGSGEIRNKQVQAKTDFIRSRERHYISAGAPVFYSDCYSYSDIMRRRPSDVLEKNHCMQRLPKALIMGVKKCGTMTLTHYLSLHPWIAINGEVDFDYAENFTAADIEQWRKKMLWSSPRMLPMTGKPRYMNRSVDMHRRLRSLLGYELKVIVMIRDPVTRAVSDYVHELNLIVRQHAEEGKTANFPLVFGPNEIHDALRPTLIDDNSGQVREDQGLIRYGCYNNTISNLLKVYDRDHVLILDGEAFVQDPYPIMQIAEEFLGVPKFYQRHHFVRNPHTKFYCANVTEHPNYSCANPLIKGRPHPPVDQDTHRILRDYYRPFNQRLARELNITFPWLLR